jgi:hypothetical protein
MIEEVGDVQRDVIVNELVSEVKKGLRNFSGVEGFQRMAQFPYSILRSSYSIVKTPYRIVKPVAEVLKRKKKDEEPSS